jgi:methylated-DNA-[protein]-cysteine S-methyltransferase
MDEKSPLLLAEFPRFGLTAIHASPAGLTHLSFVDSTCDLPQIAAGHPLYGLLTDTIHQMQEYFAGSCQVFDLPIDYSAMNLFQADVLQLTGAIPYGTTCSYGDLARRLGKPGESRAVGVALATNPLPIIIPCHRVLSADGRLRGYSGPGGLETKAWLLQLEGARLLA